MIQHWLASASCLSGGDGAKVRGVLLKKYWYHLQKWISEKQVASEDLLTETLLQTVTRTPLLKVLELMFGLFSTGLPQPLACQVGKVENSQMDY